MSRIKSNIIKLSYLDESPCEKWLDRFEDGELDITYWIDEINE